MFQSSFLKEQDQSSKYQNIVKILTISILIIMTARVSFYYYKLWTGRKILIRKLGDEGQNRLKSIIKTLSINETVILFELIYDANNRTSELVISYYIGLLDDNRVNNLCIMNHLEEVIRTNQISNNHHNWLNEINEKTTERQIKNLNASKNNRLGINNRL